MSGKITAIQMDDISTIDITKDSTFALSLEAQNRGHQLYYYLPQDLFLSNGQVLANAHKLELFNDANNYYKLDTKERINLSDVDVVLIRQDPPFDMNYITSTYILDQVTEQTLVLNNPTEIRSVSEKVWCCRFPEIMPATLISSDVSKINKFASEHKDIIIKPLYGCGGLDITKYTYPDNNLSVVVDMYLRLHNTPLMVQKYIPEISEGDKRVILIDGEPVGAVLRVPADGANAANFHVGGTAKKAELTENDLRICQTIGGELKKRGLLFVGIDIIGNYLTEVNVTSPTGIHEINRLNNVSIEKLFWDKVESII